MQIDTSKTIVVTGASRGIGLEVCRQAMAAGHNVIGLSRNTAPLEKAGVRAFAIDLADPSSLDVFFEYVRSSELVIDGLINNAGLLQNVPFNQSSWDIFESVYRVNVFGLSEMIRLSLPFVSPLGHIVNISSMPYRCISITDNKFRLRQIFQTVCKKVRGNIFFFIIIQTQSI